ALFSFFFQAEDGIRDKLVTGVQTCALPIYSAKDMPTFLPAGLAIAAVLPREDPRDVFIGGAVKTLAELPRGARVGTSSPRRAARSEERRVGKEWRARGAAEGGRRSGAKRDG